jgi:hypothetical protein
MFSIPTPQTLAAKALAIGIATLVVFAGGAYTGYRWELDAYERVIAADAIAQTKAVEKARSKEHMIAANNQAAAVAAAQAQQRIVTQTVTITKEIPHYVHDTVSCPGLTVGLARILRAAADGTDPASLSLASGQSDDTCSDVTASEVAGWFTGYAQASRANTQQLTDLIAAVKANDKEATAP